MKKFVLYNSLSDFAIRALMLLRHDQLSWKRSVANPGGSRVWPRRIRGLSIKIFLFDKVYEPRVFARNGIVWVASFVNII